MPSQSPLHLGDVRRAVEHAVDRADDIDARLLAFLAGAGLRGLAALRAIFGPEPFQGPVGGLPLVLVDGAGQEALDIGAFGRDATADHLGDRAGDDDCGFVVPQHGMRLAHRAFGALLAELFFRKAGDDDRQFMRGQGIGVMQHRGDGQVLAADRAVNDDLQALDGREDVDRTPVAARAVMIEDERHVPTRLPGIDRMVFLIRAAYFLRNSGRSCGVS